DQIQKVAALDCGADDYVTKPFGIGELLARMRAVSRRVTAVHTPTATLGAWLVDLNAHRVRPAAGAGDDQKLTPTEWRVLEILVRNPGRLVTKRHLLHEVWGPGYDSETGCLRLYLAQLRRKLEPDPAHPVHLLTETGMGYRFEPGDTSTGCSSVGESLSPIAAAEWHDHVLSWRTDLTSARTKVPPTAAATRGSRRKFADACDARARRDRDRVTTDSTSSRSPRVAPWRVGTETRVES
ncbi:MAG TPA: winged helix-turn-helix domain-containing protein, partial [Nocardioides sp.]|nr:winged helix-turn-helix domain-containing protein [Nocardioides sp.]